MAKKVLQVDGLEVSFHTRNGVVRAVNDVSFDLEEGESLGIVGESGSGKSVTAMSLLRLLPEPPAEIRARRMQFDGEDLTSVNKNRLREIRGNRMAMIFQDPMTCLNPVLTVGRQLGEALELHRGLRGKENRDEAERLLTQVGIPAPAERLKAWPHQLSGGMRQRVMIAMAISCRPTVLLADEPTTALDVTIQDQILRLLRSLTTEMGMATILITHNFGAVAGFADRVLVMYAGRIVENAPAKELFRNPRHPYTTALLRSIPGAAAAAGENGRLYNIPGSLPNPAALPPGCAFAARCDKAESRCRRDQPPLVALAPKHQVACWRSAAP